jgi:hypothetical protein
MPTSDDLLDLAGRCADKLELDGTLRHVPSFSDTEEQCEDEYEELLQATALPEDKRTLIVELADNHARHVWLQQEGAYHVGLAVGRKLRLKT